MQSIGELTESLVAPNGRSMKRQEKIRASLDFWRDVSDQVEKNPQAANEILKAAEAELARPTPGIQPGSTLEPVKFRPLDRNQRARLIFLAERLEAQTKQASDYKHGGCLKLTGLAVLRALLFHFHNVQSGKCCPTFEQIAEAAGVAYSTVAEALKRLELAGIVERIRRAKRARFGGRWRIVQTSNAYLLNIPERFRRTEGDWSKGIPSESGNRAQPTTVPKIKELKGVENFSLELQKALARLGNAIADKIDQEKEPAAAQAIAG